MTKIFIPSKGAKSWRALLGNPEKHWEKGRSARTLAKDWEDAIGFPAEIETTLKSAFRTAPQLVAAFPEHKVSLPGKGYDSQTDLFVLFVENNQLVAMAVEGKVDESFGPTISSWLSKGGKNRAERLKGLVSILGLPDADYGHIRYQLFHRTASAKLEAQRFACERSIMMVHSYSDKLACFDDFKAFGSLFGLDLTPGTVQSAGNGLFLGWTVGNLAMLKK